MLNKYCPLKIIKPGKFLYNKFTNSGKIIKKSYTE